jgi:hypothetical protein
MHLTPLVSVTALYASLDTQLARWFALVTSRLPDSARLTCLPGTLAFAAPIPVIVWGRIMKQVACRCAFEEEGLTYQSCDPSTLSIQHVHC